jgi:Glutathione S-transferase, N-terminal domain
MLDLYYWITPNGQIFLEESGLPYRIVPVNISAGEQFSLEFLKIAPNNRTTKGDRECEIRVRTDGIAPSSLGRRGHPWSHCSS